EQRIDVRVLVASNAPLDQLALTGAFRADLYYRLSVFFIRLPPLRERREDVLLLAEHLLKKHTPAGAAPPSLSAGAGAALLAHDWPGNVRELENAMFRAGHLCRAGRIEVEDLGLPSSPVEGPEGLSAPGQWDGLQKAKRRAVEAFERAYLLRL